MYEDRRQMSDVLRKDIYKKVPNHSGTFLLVYAFYVSYFGQFFIKLKKIYV